MNNWISIKEKMPEPNEMVLLFLKNNDGETGQVVGTVFHSDNEALSEFNEQFKAFEGGGDFTPTFLMKEYVIAWMELPEPPTE